MLAGDLNGRELQRTAVRVPKVCGTATMKPQIALGTVALLTTTQLLLEPL